MMSTVFVFLHVNLRQSEHQSDLKKIDVSIHEDSFDKR